MRGAPSRGKKQAGDAVRPNAARVSGNSARQGPATAVAMSGRFCTALSKVIQSILRPPHRAGQQGSLVAFAGRADTRSAKWRGGYPRLAAPSQGRPHSVRDTLLKAGRRGGLEHGLQGTTLPKLG